MNPSSVRNLKIWQEGIEVVKIIYGLSKAWPKEEQYGLISQARRASVSIPTNIAEGRGRNTPAEQARFASIALGSAYELETLLYLSGELEFCPQEALEPIQTKLSQLTKQISSFITAQERRA